MAWYAASHWQLSPPYCDVLLFTREVGRSLLSPTRPRRVGLKTNLKFSKSAMLDIILTMPLIFLSSLLLFSPQGK